MTTIISCDHHDATGLVPSTRSRARILAQLRAAQAFGEAFRILVETSRIDLKVVDDREILTADPTFRLDVDAEIFLETWRAYLAWYRVLPRGDDWQPPPETPAEIRVPPDDAT